MIRSIFVTMVLGVAAAGCAGRQPCPDPLNPQTGAQLFRLNCAGCHGVTAHGDGPISDLISVKVPDLTQIASRNEGAFPEEKIFRIVDGQSEMPAHGRHMPVWGYEFFGAEGDDETEHKQASARVDSIVKYLRSIQEIR